MKPEPLRVASPRFTRKRLILRWLHDAFCVLNSCLSSPVMRYEPPNYCRWVKGKNRNSVMCARALYSPVSPTSLLASARVSDAVGAIGEKLPDKSKKCPRPESFAPPFFGRNGVARTSAGAARRLCRSVPPWGPRRALLPLPERPRTSGSARFAAERNSRCKSHSRDGLRFFCPFSPFRGRRSLFLRPLFLKSGQREGLFREK